MARPSDTKQRILTVARVLFAQKGVQKTSLQEIADELGLTKPALYYHFSSREDLVRSIVQPVIDDGEEFIRQMEARESVTPRELLEGFFDFHFKHRTDILLLLSELTTLSELGLIERVVTWRERLAVLIWGGEPTLGQATRAVVALGGMQDCTVQFPATPENELRKATIEAAMSALGLDA